MIVISNTKELDTRLKPCGTARITTSPGPPPREHPHAVCQRVRTAGSSRDVTRLKEEVAEQNDREFVVGPSRSTRSVVELVQKVAKISATVLVLGESGTGKELLARLIHRESGRPTAPFVAVNLAAIPKELVESALFGHEKGAFTGAIRQQLGKFELAAGGTLFLDEIGDLKYELQAKLLRAVQEEIERACGTHPVKRIALIAATNVDLERAVKDASTGKTYYRRTSSRFACRHFAMTGGSPELLAPAAPQHQVPQERPGIADRRSTSSSSYWWLIRSSRIHRAPRAF